MKLDPVEWVLTRVVGLLGCVTDRADQFAKLVLEREALQDSLDTATEALDGVLRLLDGERARSRAVRGQLEDAWALLADIHRAMERTLEEEGEENPAYGAMTLVTRLGTIRGMRLPAAVLLPVVELFGGDEPDEGSVRDVEEEKKGREERGEEDHEEDGGEDGGEDREGRPWPRR